MSVRRSTQPGWPSAEAEGPELGIGTQLLEGRLVVRGELGCGGMAAAYRAFDRHLGREVALKVMHREQADRRARRSRFMAESRLTADLPAHSSVVRWLHDGVLPGLEDRPFLCTEPVLGPTLAFHLAVTVRPAVTGVASLAWSLADALAAVHDAGIVHRDVTAQNIVFQGYEADAAPVLIDFGLASRVDAEGQRLTRIDQRPGTITAMAPEQFRGAAPHPAMDVYAFGRLVYHLLTGDDPHHRVNPKQLAQMHRAGQRVAVPLLGGRARGPEALLRLIDRCLDPRADRRPSARGLSHHLEELRGRCDRGAIVVPLDGQRVPRSRSRWPRPSPELVAHDDGATSLPLPSPRVPIARLRWRLLAGGAALLAAAVSIAVFVSSVRPNESEIKDAALGIIGTAGGTGGGTSGGTGRGIRGVKDEVRVIDELTESDSESMLSIAAPARALSGVSLGSSPGGLLGSRSGSRSGPASGRIAEGGGRRRTRRQARSSTMPCHETQGAAQRAARAWSWREVLRLTTQRGCWASDHERIGLRLTAWVELRRFDACVEEGEAAGDPRWARLVERCKRRRELSRAGGSR